MSGHNSRSGLFLMEMITVILFFSICAAICVSAFAKARVTADSSRTLNDAVIQASNTAEAYKAADGDLQKTARIDQWRSRQQHGWQRRLIHSEKKSLKYHMKI